MASGQQQRVLVCGAAGWLGRAVTDVMVESSGFDVVAFDLHAGLWTAWDGVPSAGMNGRLSDEDGAAGMLNGRHVGNASVQRAVRAGGGYTANPLPAAAPPLASAIIG